jgi:hypothetical protein
MFTNVILYTMFWYYEPVKNFGIGIPMTTSYRVISRIRVTDENRLVPEANASTISFTSEYENRTSSWVDEVDLDELVCVWLCVRKVNMNEGGDDTVMWLCQCDLLSLSELLSITSINTSVKLRISPCSLLSTSDCNLTYYYVILLKHVFVVDDCRHKYRYRNK